MGAFLIYPKNFKLNPAVYAIFKKKGFDPPTYFELPEFDLLLYRKQLVDENNFFNKGKYSIYCVGTLIYKSNTYSASLYNLLSDFINKTIDPKKLLGSYFIIISDSVKCFCIIDPCGIQNVFYSNRNGIISSSFLAVVTASTNKYNLNRNAVTEILVTGNLIGPDTIFEDILRVEPALNNAPANFNWMDIPHPVGPNTQNDSDNCVTYQIEMLDNYFEDTFEFINNYRPLTGLTGGFDSRLLFLIMQRHIDQIDVFSTSRENPTKEFICASEFAKSINKKIRTIEHSPPDKYKKELFVKSLIDNLYFNDGMVRTNQLWIEEIKSRNYLIKLYGSNRICFSGVGGEQYRNAEYLIKSKYNIKKWLFYECIYRITGNPFNNKLMMNITINYISHKIKMLLNLDNSANFITLFEIKKYNNEIFNTANRTMRNSIENQLIFFLSPFTDYQVSNAAYTAYPFLGKGPEFERKMIYKLAPELAHIKTDYGYSILDKIPFGIIAIPYLKAFLGLKFFNFLYFKSKHLTNFSIYEKILEAHPELNLYCEKLNNLELGIEIKKVQKNNLLSPLLIEMGILLTELESYIDYD